jgi:hypothetical protein
MSQGNLVAFEKDTKKLVGKSVFISKNLKEKVLKKLNDQNLSRSEENKIQTLLIKIIAEEESVIKKVLEKAPMFFSDLKYRISREKLINKKSQEGKVRSAEFLEMEEELNEFLTN